MADVPPPPPGRVVSSTHAHSRRPSASFGDLLHARWAWRHAADDAAHERYELARALFEAEHGRIVDDYWCTTDIAGLAICCRQQAWRRERWSLHRITGSLAVGRPEYASLLLHGATESVRASNVLRGMSQRIAIANLFSLHRDVMAALQREDDDPTGRHSFERDLRDIAKYIGEAGARQAQVAYLEGVVRGLLALVVLAPLLALVLSRVAVPGVDTTLLVGCLIAGALGAAMSVLNRMSSGRLEISREVGRASVTNRAHVRSLGVARPFIGATFALLLYFAFKGALLEQIHIPPTPSGQFAFFVASAFLIGFGERFAKEIVGSA
jgi:hypothetical protein